MPARVSPQVFQRAFATTTRARATITSPISSMPSTQLSAHSTSVPKLGKVGRWYLPTMALIAVGFAIANALEEHNVKRRRQELTQTEKNRLLMDAYGARSTLEDIEHAFQQMEKANSMDHHDRLQDAYGERTSLRDMERAMQVYEVQ